MNHIKIGMTAKKEHIVEKKHLASSIGSGGIDVFATPSMITLMETTSMGAVDPYLSEGFCTVGTMLNVTHDAATPLGMKVWAEAELTEIKGKALTFSVTAYDEKGVIGKGIHSRYVVDKVKFLAKINKK